MLSIAKQMLVKAGLKYLKEDPIKNLPRIVNIVGKFAVSRSDKESINYYKRIINDPDNSYNKMIRKFITSTNSNCINKIVTNLILNSGLKGGQKREKYSKLYGFNVPWAILIDPTNACNLKCKGCWAADYKKSSSLSNDLIDRVIKEGKELGIYMYIFSGGEPLMRKDDILDLCRKHNDCMFSCFTNGTFIDKKFARDLAEVGNFSPAISIEGFEKETDMRRGKGTFRKIIKAMDNLKEEKVPFGFSCCYHSKNFDVVGSEEYMDFMIEKGCTYGWYFTYIPIGKDAIIDLMATSEQRKYMYYQVRKIRETKPIFAMDFWNDGEFVNGCIAGGRRYFHISASGEVEPCAFIHFSDVNIKDVSLIEALKSPLFEQYRLNQPFNENHLRPCPLLDNPMILKKMVKNTNAHSTQPEYPESVDELTEKCVRAAKNWAPVADELWEKSKEKKKKLMVG